jgi:hypothetical protein
MIARADDRACADKDNPTTTIDKPGENMKRLALALGLATLTLAAFAAGRATAEPDDGVTIVVRHTVANLDKWKVGFDGHESVRRKFGWTAHTVLTDAGDPTHVVIIGKVKTLAQAKDFTKAPSLKETMQKAGVISAPDIAFLKVVEQKTY